MRHNLIYCTYAYPGDLYSEKAFADPELKALAKHFDHIVLVPVDKEDRKMGYAERLPEGVSTDWSLVENKIMHSRLLKLVYLFHPFVLRSLHAMRGEPKTPIQWIKGMYQAISTVLSARIIRKVALRNGMTPNDTVMYSLWFHNSGSALGLLAEKEGWQVAVRGHTADLYDERMLFRSRNVRDKLLDSINYVLSISARGRNYLANRFPRHKEKFRVAKLGSPRFFNPCGHTYKDAKDPLIKKTHVELLTVARLIPLKRIDLIIDVLTHVALSHQDKEITYTIIGDGECQDSLKAKLSENKVLNLHIAMTGALSNEDIQRRYATNPPDWYIMMSSTEGIPISMCEAMSYGIPVITNNVGEITELVTPDCALIFDRDIKPQACADLISGIIFDADRREAMGRAALARWESEFNADKQADKTASLLASLLDPK